MQDNIIFATDSMRSSVNSLKKKVSNLKVLFEQLDSELVKIDSKFEKLLTQTGIYKAKLEREKGREVRKLEIELERLRKQLKSESLTNTAKDNSLELKVASTIGVFECLLRHICEGADDFRLMSCAFLYPAVYERVVRCEDPAYLLERIPSSAETVITRGKEYLEYVRAACDTHVTETSAWSTYSLQVTDWWRNDALPLLYGSRDEQWDSDVPLSLIEMEMWRDEPAERPLNFSAIFDAYEIYRTNRDSIYESSGIRSFDLQMFSFSQKSNEGKVQLP